MRYLMKSASKSGEATRPFRLVFLSELSSNKSTKTASTCGIEAESVLKQDKSASWHSKSMLQYLSRPILQLDVMEGA